MVQKKKEKQQPKRVYKQQGEKMCLFVSREQNK